MTVPTTSLLTRLDEVPDAVIDICRLAFSAPEYGGTPEAAEAFRTEQLPKHSGREDFRLVVGYVDRAPAGFCYGYTGRRGQFWTDRVAERVPAEVTDAWVGGHFEFVELAVDPAYQRLGVGQAVHDRLLAGLPHDRALLSTWPVERGFPAGRLYVRNGWHALATLDDDTVLMGRRLHS